MKAYVGKRKDELFQVDSLCTIEDVYGTLGHFVEFVLEEEKFEQSSQHLSGTNAFSVLLQGAKSRSCLPSQFIVNNNKDKLKNDVISWLEKNKVGWSKDLAQTQGNKFVNILSNILWDIDGNHSTLASRGYGVPAILTQFEGYNKPEMRKRKKISVVNLKKNNIQAHSSACFDLASQAYMNADPWHLIKEGILQLADNLRKYVDFLEKTNAAMKEHHEKTQTKDVHETDKFRVINASHIVTPSLRVKYHTLVQAINNSGFYEVINVNNHSPTIPSEKFRYVHNLVVPSKCVLFMYTGAKENLNFLWKVPVDVEMNSSEYIQRNNANIQEIKKNLPKFHTRAMRREFVQLFGRVIHSKAAFLREAYRRLTGDAASANCLSEEEVDKRVAEMLDHEDEDLICDLRHHNPGRPEQYQEKL